MNRMNPNDAWARSNAGCAAQPTQRRQDLEVLRHRHALVHAIELGLGEALDADQERRDDDARARGRGERALEPPRARQQPVGAGLEQQREAADALGGAPLEQLGQVAERVLIAQHQARHRRGLAPHVRQLRQHRRDRLGLGPRLVVVAGGAEPAAAAEAVGQLDAGVARVGAGVGLVRAAGVAVDRKHALGRQVLGVDHQRRQVGHVRVVGGRRQRRQAWTPAVGGADPGADRHGRAPTGQEVEQVRQRPGLDLVAPRRIGQRVLAAPVRQRGAGQRRRQRRRDRAGPHPLVDHDLERAQGRDQAREHRARGRRGAVEGHHHQPGVVPGGAGAAGRERQGAVVEERAVAVAVEAEERDPRHR
ncbi:MAG: hypothetical protein IPL61_03910 [Myxococcales bacterium]|nr:hypothetical protein [Myxococcales bacterium]